MKLRFVGMPFGLACAMLLVVSCHTSNNPRGRWVYGISREAYGCEGDWFHFEGVNHPSQIVLIPVILAAPFVIDTVLLPITVPRDVMYR